MIEELDQVLTKSTEALTSKWKEFAATHLDALTGMAQRVAELKTLAEKSTTGATTSSVPVSAHPDARKWLARDNRGQVPSAALILTDAVSHSEMSMTVGIDYTKLSMTELHLCQLVIMKEIQARDHYSQMQLVNTMKQNASLAVQFEEEKQSKRDAECKKATLV